MKTTSFGAVQSDQLRNDQRFKQQNEVYLRLIQDMKLKHEKEIKKLTEAHVSEIQKLKKAKAASASGGCSEGEEVAKLKRVIDEQKDKIKALEEIVSKAKELFR
ncbi:hypothetical protein QR680_018422 [Steinernema hermaphroditum]|uniref:Uncharacterized protein n=1 Tax=Steinernema hermaphroditum TaxID=289476 RepID=A0AA39LR32_9BILA|nr:hypothetical protein QR680_018422 [Steinernema hermaphroditum]